MPLSPQVSAIPYHADSAPLFEAVRHLPYATWLDSGRPGSSYGRYDIISAAPATLLTTRGATTCIRDCAGQETLSTENPFTLLARYLPPNTASAGELPFCGGALGYFGYDLARRLENLPETAVQDIDQPELCIGIYPWAVVQDHERRKAWLVALPGFDTSEITGKIGFHDLKPDIKSSNKLFKINGFKTKVNADTYAKSVARIKQYITAGDCYQVNYAQRFDAEYSGDPYAAYLTLRQALPSPFSGFMQLEQGAVLSLSPERFVRVRNGVAETQPIKGTIQRGKNPSEDQRNAETLKASLKDRAENLMIVDLLRNDLSKTCDEVRVPTLFELQSFANVHHLVSTVTGKLKPGATALDLLEGCFPGGSITGAPKIRAMEIIEELEPTRRSIYCGSLGYISADGNMDTNIAIRSLVCDRGKIHCWGGGGIVADSEIDKEYQESFAKVQVLLDTLEENFGARP
jgi:para-aminobenzoate synthetase component 1